MTVFARSVRLGLPVVVFAVCLVSGCRSAPTPDSANELPFGVIDQPRSNETVGRVVDVSGWALDDSRVANVWGYVDGKYQTSATLTEPRLDVSKAFPAYRHEDDVHGWRLQLDLGERPGAHAILIQAVDDERATRDLGSVTVTLIGR